MLARYGMAVACIAIAIAVRMSFAPQLPIPYLSAYFAVLLVCRYGGLGPAVLTSLSCAVAFAVIEPPIPLTRIPLFFVASAVVIWLVEDLRRARADAERHALVADERLAQLEIEVAQRAAEERLSAQLRAIVESSDDAIVSKSLDGVIQSWNRGAEAIFGYTAAEAIGSNIAMLLPPDRIYEESEMVERIRGGARVKHFETVRIRKDGKPIHVSLTVSPIRGADGAIAGASNIARDITEDKEFEDQLRQTQKLESLGVLAGGLAHDFNNLLTGIMGNASLAADQLGPSHTAHPRLDEVLQASERAALVVRQMLAYAGKGRFHLELLDLSAQVREILPLLRTSISKFIDVRMTLTDDLPPVEADRAQVQQLIMNLAINAAEAIGDRPGTVTITTSHRRTEAERLVVLRVADTGCGMTDEVRDRIFEPFYTTKFTGRGLGLAAVMGIIRAHHGSISVDSQPGDGAAFTVVLPAASGTPQQRKTETDTELRGFGLVLVADDEELVRNMAKFTLGRFGYSVELANDGREAVEKFNTRPTEFAAVLLDLTMPVMNGQDAMRAIRAVRRDVPVVLSSGYTESEALKQFADLGLSGFLQKPYTASTLARKIKRALDSRARLNYS